jgi:hypothetical protein
VIHWHRLDDASRETAVPRNSAEFVGVRIPLIETPAAPVAPQAKIIEQRPSSAVAPHFHRVHQFQVFSAGSGLLGRTQLAPLTVHYTSPETGYGPIQAGPEGLSYYVLRPQKDDGAMFLPQSRDRMRGLPKRHALSQAITPRANADLRGLRAPVLDECIALTPQGMAVWRVGLPPATALAVDDVPGAGPRFYLVAAGELAVEGAVLGAGSLCFAESGDGFCLQSTAAGADVLLMQYPLDAVGTE